MFYLDTELHIVCITKQGAVRPSEDVLSLFADNIVRLTAGAVPFAPVATELSRMFHLRRIESKELEAGNMFTIVLDMLLGVMPEQVEAFHEWQKQLKRGIWPFALSDTRDIETGMVLVNRAFADTPLI